MADGLKNYMWFPIIIALLYTIYSNNIYKDIAYKLIIGNLTGAYHSYSQYSNDVDVRTDGRLFTKEELGEFNDLNKGLYLAIVGNVFDVTQGKKHYGKGENYHGFIGKDASFAFLTGEFTEENLTDDISSITDFQAKSIDGWIKFYVEKYTYKGKLIGRFYDKEGAPTAEYYKFKSKVYNADEARLADEETKQKFPPCNVEWKLNEGTKFWCTKQSGGISREWEGVPRLYFEDPTSTQSRCACVNLDSYDFYYNQGKFKKYDECDENSAACYVMD